MSIKRLYALFYNPFLLPDIIFLLKNIFVETYSSFVTKESVPQKMHQKQKMCPRLSLFV